VSASADAHQSGSDAVASRAASPAGPVRNRASNPDESRATVTPHPGFSRLIYVP
jgi:hypothetical protein